MDSVLQPWQLYFVILAGWVNRQQQQVINYLRTENQVPIVTQLDRVYLRPVYLFFAGCFYRGA